MDYKRVGAGFIFLLTNLAVCSKNKIQIGLKNNKPNLNQGKQ